MSTLVTGGAGFIGSHLCEALLSGGRRVVCVDDFNDFYDPAIKEHNVAGCRKNRNFALYRADIRDIDALKKIFAKEKPEKIVHLAARAGVRPSIAQPLLYEEVNVKGTLNLLELARRHNARQFVFGSSSSVYGLNRAPFSEADTDLRPISPYAATKKAGEELCYTYHHLYKIPVTCLRFFTVYGPRQRPDLAIHKFTRLLFAGLPIPLFGDGSTMRDYTYSDDIIGGILASLKKELPYEIINLGNSKPVRLRDLIARLEQATGKKAIIAEQPEQAGDVPVTSADITKAKKLLGWKPRTPLARGLAAFIEWFSANRSLLSSAAQK